MDIYYPVIKKEKNYHLLQHGMKFEGILPSNMSERERQILYALTFMLNIKRKEN